jgi:nucleotide-binding universal stress UspA family protein
METNRVQIERILCPTDFSRSSARALAHAIGLARQFEARLELLHVVPSPGSAMGGGYFPATRELLHQAGSELRQCAGPAIRAGVPVVTTLREGEPGPAIQALAESLPADLVVMGTHGRAGFEYLVLGSVAEQVLRRAPCPVLTVGLESRPPLRAGSFFRILCATDLSDSSADTVAFALALAEEQQSELTLLHVLEGLQLYEDVPELEHLRRRPEEVARARLAAAVPPAVRDWCSVRELVTVGRPHHEVLRVAAASGADVVVMGSRGRDGIGRMLFGSTSQRVVRGAGCPVLTVRPVKRPSTALVSCSAGRRGRSPEQEERRWP